MEKSPIKNDWQIKSLYLIYPKDFKKTTVADIVFSKNSSNLALKKPCFCPGYSNKSQRDPTCSIFFLNFRAVSSKTILSSLPKKNIAGGASFFILCIIIFYSVESVPMRSIIYNRIKKDQSFRN